MKSFVVKGSCGTAEVCSGRTRNPINKDNWIGRDGWVRIEYKENKTMLSSVVRTYYNIVCRVTCAAYRLMDDVHTYYEREKHSWHASVRNLTRGKAYPELLLRKCAHDGGGAARTRTDLLLTHRGKGQKTARESYTILPALNLQAAHLT